MEYYGTLEIDDELPIIVEREQDVSNKDNHGAQLYHYSII